MLKSILVKCRKAIVLRTGNLLCWFDFHKIGEPYSFPNEYDELPNVLLVRCVRCGALFRIV